MKVKPFVMLLALITPVYFIFAPKTTHIPYDLRDAVSDGAFDSLAASGSDVDVPEVPAPAARAVDFEDKSIYGADDRQDYYKVSDAMKELSNSVVSLWEAKDVTVLGKKAGLKVVPFGTTAGLCPGERFAEQPLGPFCSGTLVGEDVVMTAGHCVRDVSMCAATKFVFGFALKKEGDYPQSVPVGEVYGCRNIIKRDLDENTGGILNIILSVYNGGEGPDFALIRLDRKVTGHRPLPIHKKARPAKGDRLFVIGHPVGLPLKVAGNARVRDASPRYFFQADLDTFGGNSGSAVFNADTRLIEGILVRGDTDFAKTPFNCLAAVAVPQNGGRGESVTKISVVEKYLPK